MFTQVAKLNGDQVAVRKVRKKSIREDKLLLKEMKIMKSLKHTNLATFHGACTESPNICVLWEYCSKGSLEDILHNQDIKLESMFQFSIALDICTGLNYLHTSELGVHGRLKTSNCVVDSRWVAKLTDFGLKRFKKGEKPADDTSTDKYYTDLLWTAPEVLRSLLNNEKVTSTKEADVYSLGIVLKQLLCKNFAYSEELQYMSAKDIIMRIAQVEPEHIQMRPHIIEEFPEHQVVMMSFVKLIKSCWSEDPTHRPTIKQVLRNMKRMSPLKMTGVLDNMLALMERYSTRLEDLVSERTLQLEEEKRKTDTLLYRMLPRKVADDLKAGQHVQAEAFQDVTIYFSDIVGFTTLAGESTPMEIVEMLNLLYSQFDNIIQNFNVYKVETIGDAYMVVCGCPEPNPDHAPVMADMSLALLDSVIHFVIPHRPQNQLRIRIGLNSGPVVAGVVGNTMPRYCLFGNTVNLASRMESQGMPLRIQLSYFTYEILKNDPDFIMVPRGLVEIKGKGMMPTYWLKGRRSTMEVHLETDKLARSANSVQANAFINKEAIEKKAPEITNQQTTVDLQLTSDITHSPTSNKDVDHTKHTCDLMYSRFPDRKVDELDTINCAPDQCWDDHFRNLSSKTDKPFQNNSSGQSELKARPDSYLASDSAENGNYAGDNFGRSFSDRSFGSNESFHTLVLSKQNGFTIFKDALQYVPSSVSECELNSVSKHVSGHVPANVVSDQATKKENSGNSGQRISVTTSLNSLATPPHKVKIATLPAIIPTPHNATEKEGSPFYVKSTLKNKAKSHSKVPAFGASENGFMDEKGKDYSPPRSKSFTDSLAQYSSDEDTSDRTAVIYSPRPSPSKKSPIKYHPGKDPSLKKPHTSRADGTNGVTIYDEDESDPSEKISFIEKHKNPAQNDAKNIVSMQKLKKDMFSKHTPNAHNRHSPTKKPAEKYSLQPIEKLRLLNSPSWNEKGQLNTKAFDVHLDMNKKSKNYQKKVTSQHGKPQSADGNLREKVIDSNHLELCDKSFEI
ncbi:receptor-type guanylate cyclase gcy-28-like isoform X2 [Physella acuta]|nr:receptor-type guanylate cyclase gcy-28-like isoform X2 [Physella acuta]